MCNVSEGFIFFGSSSSFDYLGNLKFPCWRWQAAPCQVQRFKVVPRTRKKIPRVLLLPPSDQSYLDENSQCRQVRDVQARHQTERDVTHAGRSLGSDAKVIYSWLTVAWKFKFHEWLESRFTGLEAWLAFLVAGFGKLFRPWPTGLKSKSIITRIKKNRSSTKPWRS